MRSCQISDPGSVKSKKAVRSTGDCDIARIKNITKGDAENEPSFDFALNGNQSTRNLNLNATLPMNPAAGYVRGQLFVVRLKDTNDAQNETLSSVSYMLQLEGEIPPRVLGGFTPPGHLEPV